METVGAPLTAQASAASVSDMQRSENNASGPRTPKQTYINFEGDMTQLRTDQIVGGKLTRSCTGFLIHIIVLAVAAIVGLVQAIRIGYGQPEFAIWMSLFNLAVGGMLPNPSLKK